MHANEMKGHWALVTGASSGIGREFAVQLAALGANLVLVARRADRLESLAAELTGRHGVRALALPFDLAAPECAGRIRQHLREEGVQIRLLCNMAGLGRWAKFEASPAPVYEEMIQVNAVAVVSLCREFLPDLAAQPTGAIINASSPAAYQPVPYMAVYAATKAFVHSFSQALYAECQASGVLVQTLVPGPIASELEGVSAMPDAEPSARSLVRLSLSKLTAGTPVVLAAKRTLLQRLFALLPPRLVLGQVSRMFSPHK